MKKNKCSRVRVEDLVLVRVVEEGLSEVAAFNRKT